MSQKAAETGPGAMGFVAMEQLKFQPGERIVRDDLAYPILPFSMRAAIRLKAGPLPGDFIVKQAEKKVPGLWGSIMCRKRYVDEMLSRSVGVKEVEAVVNLGAGFDTRAYRLPVLTDTNVFELDQPRSISLKRRRLEKLYGSTPDNVALVPIDFDREGPGEALRTSGWDAALPTFFIWEGVTQYLSESGVRSTMKFLAEAARGSRMIYTYVRQDFLNGENLYGLEFLYDKMVRKDQVWLYGMDPEKVPDFLKEYGWRALEHLGYEDLAKQYVKPTGRHLLSMPIERIVYAQKT